MSDDYVPVPVPAALASLKWDGMIPVRQVLDHVVPAYGGHTWADAIAHLLSTPPEATVVSELALSGPNGWQRPIRVWFDDEDGVFRIGNGMHRMAAAVGLGLDTILCTSSATADSDDDTSQYVEVRYRLPGEWVEGDFENDAIGFASGWLRSFPLPDGTWVETDLVSQSGDVLEGMWLCPHSHAEALVEELARRAPMFELVAMRRMTGAEWSAELDADLADFHPATAGAADRAE